MISRHRGIQAARGVHLDHDQPGIRSLGIRNAAHQVITDSGADRILNLEQPGRTGWRRNFSVLGV